MKKFLQILSAIVVSTGFIGSIATAQSCDLNQDNPDNGNTTEVECETVRNVNITCENNIYVATIVTQAGQSGNGTVTGNQSSGSVSTGTVANYNGNQITIGANCGGSTETPETPVTPGGGSTTPSAPVVPTAAPKQAVAALPFTASNDTVAIAIASIVGIVVALALSRLAIAAYRRTNK